MMLDRVKIGNADTSLSGKGGRTMDVRVSSSESFSTPVRPITTIELTAKSFLGYRGELVSPIAALPLDISGNKYQKFLKNNGTVEEARRKLKSLSMTSFNQISFPIIQIRDLGTDKEGLYAEKIAFDMQKHITQLDYLSMPPMLCDSKTYEKRVTDWCQSSIDEYGKGCVPQLSFSEDEEMFRSKLDVLISLTGAGLINIINIRYASPDKYPHQFAELWSKKDKIPAIINCSEVPLKNNQLAPGIYADVETDLIQYGVDSISRKKYTVSPKLIVARNNAPPAHDLDECDNFYYSVHNASAKIEKGVWTSSRHSEICRCPVCNGSSREEIISKFAYKDNGEIELSGLNYFSKLHDHQSDQTELSNIRNMIHSNEMADYQIQTEDNRKSLIRRMS